MDAKVVLVTGGSSGIGKSICVYLKSKGYQVFGTTRDTSKFTKDFVVDLVQMDVRDPSSIQSGIAEVMLCAGRIDVLVNNAGIGITGPVEETPHDAIQNTFDTNFHGPLHLIKAVMPVMREQQSGLIINITSIAGYIGLPYRGVYSASKAALEILTESIRMESRKSGVRITNLAPGDFATNIASGRYHAPVKEGSPHADDYERTLKMIDADVKKGNDPIMVAKKVHSLILKRKPGPHYLVGSGFQKFSVFLKKILPDKVYELMVLKHYKL